MGLPLITGFPLIGSAQAPSDSDSSGRMSATNMSSALFVHIGPFLAARAGLREQLPMFGANYSFPFRETFLDVGAAASQLNDTRLVSGSLGVRHNFPIDRDLVPVMILGIDGYFIERPGLDPSPAFGVHVGGGIVYSVINKLALRTDAKLNIGPGFSLYLRLGLEYYFDKGSDSSSQ